MLLASGPGENQRGCGHLLKSVHERRQGRDFLAL